MKLKLLVMLFLAIGAGFIFLTVPVHAKQDAPTRMTIATSDFNLFPWFFTDSTGVMIEALNIVGKRLNVEITFKHYPFLRAMAMLEQGQLDGYAPATFKEYRRKFGQFPDTEGGQLDTKKAVFFEGYSIYTLKDSNLDFDGKNFSNLIGKIGTQPGFAVIKNLKALGVGDHLDSGAKGQENNLKKVLSGRIQAAALLQTSADYFLKTDARFSSQIKRLPIPISDEGLYLVLSHNFVKTYPEFSQKLWQTIEQLRNSKEFKKLFEKYKAQCRFCP